MMVLKTVWDLGQLVSFKILQEYNRLKLCHPGLVLWSCPARHIMPLLHDPVSGWLLFWVNCMIIIILYFNEKSKAKIIQVEFFASSSFSKGSRKGLEWRPPLFHASQLRWPGAEGSAPCILLHVWAQHVSLGYSPPELHNHLEPQGSNMSDLLKVRQVEAEPRFLLFF